MSVIVQILTAMLRMQYWAAWALINYGWVFLMFSISHRWLIASAWFLLGVVVGRAPRDGALAEHSDDTEVCRFTGRAIGACLVSRHAHGCEAMAYKDFKALTS